MAEPKVCPHCGGEYDLDLKFCPKDGTALRSSVMEGLLGSVIADRYHILRKIGEGAMGQIYLAEHVKMGRRAAIKVISPRLVDDHDAISRFGREAANASRISHPNVAAIYDFGEAGDLVYLAMEYVDGEPLYDLLQRTPRLEPPHAVDLTRQILDGLTAAHELGIVHRDLKPDNIMIAKSRSGRDVVKVVDFGIAKAMVGGEQNVTRTGFVVGTPEYMSPEALSGDPVDGRSDLYAVGCILYKMLTGEPCFPGTSAESMINRRLSEPPPRPRVVVADLPRQLDEIAVRALARSPADRFQSAQEFRDALDAVYGPSAAVVSGPRGRTRSTAVRPPRARRREYFAAGVIATAVVVSVVGWRVTHREQPDAEVTRVAAVVDTMILEDESPAAAAPMVSPVVQTASAPEAAKAITTPSPQVATPPRRSDPPRVAADPPRMEPQRSDTRSPSSAVQATPPPVEIPRTPAREGPTLAPPESSRLPVAQPSPPVERPADVLPDLQSLVASVARAYSARDIAELRKVNPGITRDEQERWSGLFSATERVSANLVVQQPIEVQGNSAEARVVATYTFDYRRGVSGDRVVTAQYRAVFRRDGGTWRLVSMR